MRQNPAVNILIDRDLSVSVDGLVATFVDDVTLFRVMDGEELCIIATSGSIEGGMFAISRERQYGASWAATSPEDVVGWGASWSKQKRLGKDLFVAEIGGRGRKFFHELTLADKKEIKFDPNGPPFQEARFDAERCNTGLGCSIVVSTKDAKFYRVKSGQPKPMTHADVEEYVRKHPLPEVALRPYSGAGNDWFAGVILGRSVAVGKDQDDGLWRVENRRDEPFVWGAKTKKEAIEAAVRMIERGGYDDGPAWRLNKVPPGFERVAVGQKWESLYGVTLTIDRIGANYVAGDAINRWGEDIGTEVVPAAVLMKDWERQRGRSA